MTSQQATRPIPPRALRKRVLAAGMALCSSVVLGSWGAAASATTAPARATLTSSKVDLSGVTLRLGQITPIESAEIQASGVLNGTPYQVSWSTFLGPAPLMTALLANDVDAGINFGDVSVTLANADSGTAWTKADAPVKTIAVEDSVTPPYETIATTSSGITKLSQIKGKRFAYDPGGNIQAQYLLDLKKAKLTPSDVSPVVIQAATLESTFQAGATDVESTSTSTALPLVEAGTARVIATQKSVGLPGLDAFVASAQALQDPAKKAAFANLLTRLSKFYAWYAKHTSTVAGLLESVNNVPTQYAEQEAKLGESYFIPTTPAVLAEEQNLASTLVEGGVITTKVEVAAQYDTAFNNVIEAADAKYGVPKAST